jgi:hypothetical protein
MSVSNRSGSSSNPRPSDAYVIEADHAAAGIAIRERGGFRFYASTAPFWDIDQRKFRRIRDIHTAIRGLIGPTDDAVDIETPSDAKFVDCIYA